MANQLVHVTNFPYNSIVFDQYLLISGGNKRIASVAFVARDSAIGDDAVEVRIGDDEPYEVEDLEEALVVLDQNFGGVDEEVNMTYDQARDAGLVG